MRPRLRTARSLAPPDPPIYKEGGVRCAACAAQNFSPPARVPPRVGDVTTVASLHFTPCQWACAAIQRTRVDCMAEGDPLCQIDAAWEKHDQKIEKHVAVRRDHTVDSAVTVEQVQAIADQFSTIADMLDNCYNEVNRDIANARAPMITRRAKTARHDRAELDER